MKFMSDYDRRVSFQAPAKNAPSTNQKLLQIVLQWCTSEQKAPLGINLHEVAVTLALEVLEDVPFIKYTGLDKREHT